MNSDELVCWSCGSSLTGVPMPISRISECLSCRRKLHVCLMCEFHDPLVAQACREPMAEEVADKQWANFCDYFGPRPDAFDRRDDAQRDNTPSALAALFGGDEKEPGSQERTDPDQETTQRQLNKFFDTKD
jgi:hypothetical protein